MKLTLHTLVSDTHNSGVEVSVHPNRASLDAALTAIMEEEVRDDPDPSEEVQEMRRLIEAGKIDEAWDLFTDDESAIKHPDDYYYVEEHAVEIPAASAL